jgi:hypothetical protein
VYDTRVSRFTAEINAGKNGSREKSQIHPNEKPFSSKTESGRKERRPVETETHAIRRLMIVLYLHVGTICIGSYYRRVSIALPL